MSRHGVCRGIFRVGLFPMLSGVRCFAEGQMDGVIWGATPEGLFRFEEARWREVKGPAGRSLKDVLCLRSHSDGALWIGGGGLGVLRLLDGNWSAISKTQ